MCASLNIRLKKASKTYIEGEIVSGVMSVSCPTEVRHDGLTLQLEGSVDLQPYGKTNSILEAFSAPVKPIILISQTVELASPGKIPAGLTEIPFEIPLRPKHAPTAQYPGLLESYHGLFISVTYMLRGTLKKSFLTKPAYTSTPLLVQFAQSEPVIPQPAHCVLTPESVGGAAAAGGPRFHIEVELASVACALDRPITGQICVKECSVPIKSIELQLVRVETCGCLEGYARDATEIQNIQMAQGDVRRGVDIPLYMVLPRIFTCPTTRQYNFKIEFELNVAIIFQDDHLVLENFPILLVRSQ